MRLVLFFLEEAVRDLRGLRHGLRCGSRSRSRLFRDRARGGRDRGRRIRAEEESRLLRLRGGSRLDGRSRIRSRSRSGINAAEELVANGDDGPGIERGSADHGHIVDERAIRAAEVADQPVPGRVAFDFRMVAGDAAHRQLDGIVALPSDRSAGRRKLHRLPGLGAVQIHDFHTVGFSLLGHTVLCSPAV